MFRVGQLGVPTDWRNEMWEDDYPVDYDEPLWEYKPASHETPVGSNERLARINHLFLKDELVKQRHPSNGSR